LPTFFNIFEAADLLRSCQPSRKEKPLADNASSKCLDDTEPIVINIPCRLIERAQKYADEHSNTITGVVIEALDALLSGRTTDGFR
jgi:hypothetical protein